MKFIRKSTGEIFETDKDFLFSALEREGFEKLKDEKVKDKPKKKSK